MNSMPVDLVLIRHGESEGNLAQARSKQGDESGWTDAFRKRHTSQYRLTDLGREQAKCAANWLKTNGGYFDRCFTSEYVRAMETAALLEIPDAKWYCEFYLRELDKGILANKSKKDRACLYNEELQRKAIDPFFYAAPGGESVADCCIRVEKVLDILRRTCAGLRVAIVCHGNIMKAFRVRMERMSQAQYYRHFVDENATEEGKIRNCQIIWYTRRSPHNHRVSSKYRWMQSVCPWDPKSLASQIWREIDRPNYTNEQLLAAVQSIPQLVNYREGENYTDFASKGDSVVPESPSHRSPKHDRSFTDMELSKDGNTEAGSSEDVRNMGTDAPVDIRNPKRLKISTEANGDGGDGNGKTNAVDSAGGDSDSGEDPT